MSEEVPGPDLRLGLERLIFFSDAVFAIAITLLVIDLRLPDLGRNTTEGELEQALSDVVPRLAAYGLSFAVIGLYWLAHWRRFQYIEHVDSRLVAINLLLLGFIAVIPFPTSVIGDHGDLPAAVVLYALTLAVAGVVGGLSWLYAWRAGLTQANLDPQFVRLAALRGLVVPIVMLLSLPLTLVGPLLAQASWLLIFPIQAAIRQRARVAGPGTTV